MYTYDFQFYKVWLPLLTIVTCDESLREYNVLNPTTPADAKPQELSYDMIGPITVI